MLCKLPEFLLAKRKKIKSKRSSTLVFCYIVLVIIYIIFFYLNKNYNELNSKSLILTGSRSNNLDVLSAQINTTRFPFDNITIPYLRNYQYHSQLSDLKLVSENPIYDGYLTSYLSEGLTINGLLMIPKGPPPKDGWPAVVFIHGYIIPKEYKTLQNYTYYADHLVTSGLVVFKIDLRGYADSEGDSNGTYYSSDYIIDSLNAYSALQNAGFINSRKIGLWGHSMGGNIVMRTMAIKPDIPAAVIWSGAVYTYTDFVKYSVNDKKYQSTLPDEASVGRMRGKVVDIYGEPSEKSIFWQQVVPTNYLKDFKGALQLHHAADDEVVSVAYSRELNSLLNKTTIPHEYYEYSSGGHNIIGYSYNQAMQNTVEFFKKYLQ